MGAPRSNRRSRVLVGILLVFCLALTARSVSAANFVTLHGFAGGPDDGASPAGALIQATDGNFYGTTSRGGVDDAGTVFRMTPDGTVTLLYSFTGGEDGGTPVASLIQATDGNLYGTTQLGGDAACAAPSGCGTVFRITLGGSLTTLHPFTASDPGSQPIAGLLQARDGDFYGATGSTIFRLTLDGTFTTLHDFAPNWTIEGSGPNGLVQGLDGNFYGTNQWGGGAALGYGTVFGMHSDGSVWLLHTFEEWADGGSPTGPLIQGLDGNFYGVTSSDFISGNGLIFRVTPDGTFTVMYAFGPYEGPPLHTGLLQGTDGNFYGTSGSMAFRMTPGGTVTALHMGGVFQAPLIHGRDGNFYSTRVLTDGGSTLGDAFRLDNSAPCDDAITLRYTAGTLTIGFTLKTAEPATWSSWLLYSGGVASLWSVPVPAVTPAVSFALPIPKFPAIGDILMVTTLSMPTGIICADWRVVNTGQPLPVKGGQ